ncbi:MAG: hypothetical protein PHU88_05620, partial [candidate division Zixibacteria bacterium]|nr:hypothetical protein [candidate division Zixibacteria bacterium]
MSIKGILKVMPTLFLLIFTTVSIYGRAKYVENDGKKQPALSASPAPMCPGTHNVGKIVLAVHNNGNFGYSEYSTPWDCFTGEIAPYCEYPKNTNSQYLYAGCFWIGAVVGRDTLVSVGSDGWQHTEEMFPYESPFGDMVRRSIIDPAKPQFIGAVSEQDYISVYTDTFTTGVPGLNPDFIDGRPHRPLHIEITQRSYAWSYPYAEDFVLFDYVIKNIGREQLN